MAEATRHLCDASSGTRGKRLSLSAPKIAKPMMTTAQNNRQNAINWRLRVSWWSHSLAGIEGAGTSITRAPCRDVVTR